MINFYFMDFYQKKRARLIQVLEFLKMCKFSQVFFIQSKKINFYLKKFKKYYSGRKIMISKKITKIHETHFRGNIDDFNLFDSHIKGELTVVISDLKAILAKPNKEEIVN